jgi:transposase
MGSGRGSRRCKWKSLHKRFTRWAKTGVAARVFASLVRDRDNQYPDARQHPGARPSAGGDRKRGACDQALGRSRGGLTTKIHMAADTFGRPVRFILTAGQSGDILAAPALLDGFDTDAVLADKAYDSNALRAIIAEAGAQAVIPSNRSRKTPIPHDAAIHKHRNRIERCFNKLKHFRRFATRYDRRALHFLSFIQLAQL